LTIRGSLTRLPFFVCRKRLRRMQEVEERCKLRLGHDGHYEVTGDLDGLEDGTRQRIALIRRGCFPCGRQIT
jgi:hypothetical protein